MIARVARPAPLVTVTVLAAIVVDRRPEWIDDYIAHRQAREEQILDLLTNSGTTKIDDLVGVIYADINPDLHPVARYTVHAHLLKLAKVSRWVHVAWPKRQR